ncbi:MAG: ABC transporter permease [Pseudomonadota bacterium]
MRNVFLVFRRDYLSYVTAWGFWLGLAALPILMVLGAVVGGFAANSAPVRYYTVIETGDTYSRQIEAEFDRSLSDSLRQARDQFSAIGPSVDDETLDRFLEEGGDLQPKFIQVDPPAESIDALRPWLLGEQLLDGPAGQKPLFAAIIVPTDGSDIQYWSEDVNVSELRLKVQRAARTISRVRVFADANLDPGIIDRADAAALRVREQRIRTAEEQVASGNEVTLADRAPFFVSLGIAYILWLMIFSVIQYLLMGTIEERSNKIFDTLLTSVRLPQLLAGKLGAVFAVTATMMSTWALLGSAGLAFGLATMSDEMSAPLLAALGAGFSPQIMIPAMISFILGYLMYGVIFMALGSLCDTIQEAQTLLSPLMILLMLPMIMIIVAFNDPTSPAVAISSWVPLFTPFVLILRMPTEPPLWEVIVQIGLMAVTTMAVLWLATKVYRAGAVHGAGVGDAVDWIKRLIPGMGPKQARS